MVKIGQRIIQNEKGDFKQFSYTSHDGEKITLTGQFLGKGSFATCFKVGSMVYSFIRTDKDQNDYSKFAISEWADSDNVHIPNFKNVGEWKHGEVFTSPLYNDLTKESVKAWSQYRIISRHVEKNLNYQIGINAFTNRDFINSLTGMVEDSIIEALQSMNDSMINYSDNYMMEFPKRNLKVDENGNLIFLDVFFNPKALKWYRS